MYAGGIESAGDLVQTGRARPDDFRLLAGYTGWGAAQLRQEVAEGAWWVVAASSELIKECLKGAWAGAALRASRAACFSVPTPAQLPLVFARQPAALHPPRSPTLQRPPPTPPRCLTIGRRTTSGKTVTSASFATQGSGTMQCEVDSWLTGQGAPAASCWASARVCRRPWRCS